MTNIPVVTYLFLTCSDRQAGPALLDCYVCQCGGVSASGTRRDRASQMATSHQLDVAQVMSVMDTHTDHIVMSQMLVGKPQ